MATVQQPRVEAIDALDVEPNLEPATRQRRCWAFAQSKTPRPVVAGRPPRLAAFKKRRTSY
jgi:hypothetical protein